MMHHRRYGALATLAVLVGSLLFAHPAVAASVKPSASVGDKYQQFVAALGTHRAEPTVSVAATLPPTASVADPKGDVSSCQGDLVSASVDFHQASTLALGVVTACASNPNTDPHWIDPNAVTSIGFVLDVNGDGDAEYIVIVASPLGGGPARAFVFHVANDVFSQTCSGSLEWNGSTGFSVSVPTSCVGSPSQVQVYAGMTWDENPTGDTCTCETDFAPDAGWMGPVGPVASTPPPPPPAEAQGYWLVASDGGIFSFGDAHFFGSTGAMRLNQPIVGMASAPGGQGYWFVASDGGIFSFGNAPFFGSTGAIHLNKPIVGMAATPDGGGYWLVASDGGIFSFGDARFLGSTGALHLNKPIVGMTPTVDGRGYYLVASDGGIFSFGDAEFFGSTGALHLNKPIVGMAVAGAGRGYWFVAADGGLFNFGPDAAFYGSGVNKAPTPVVGISATPDRLGFRLVTADGRVESFGDAQNVGDMTGQPLAHPVVGMATPT